MKNRVRHQDIFQKSFFEYIIIFEYIKRFIGKNIYHILFISILYIKIVYFDLFSGFIILDVIYKIGHFCTKVFTRDRELPSVRQQCEREDLR